MVLYLVAFSLAVILGFVGSHAVKNLCEKYSFLDYPTRRKQHLYPIPHLGGLALFAAFWVSFGLVYILSDIVRVELEVRLPMLFLASVIILLTGLLDDLVNLTYLHKIAGQLAASVIVIAAGFVITRFHIPFWGSLELDWWAAYPVTVAWIVLLSNSINLIDGSDGLAASVSIVTCIGLLITGTLLEVYSVIAISLCLGGALIGFLFLNWPPARLFMGDSGSLFLGFMFALVAVICPIKSYTAVSMFVPLVAVGVPLIEVLVTFVRRTVTGQRFYIADNRHIYNYLQDYGLDAKQTIYVLAAVSLALTAFIPALFWFDRKKVFSIFVLFLLTLLGLFFVLKLGRSESRSE